jgi:hypothetical protein
MTRKIIEVDWDGCAEDDGWARGYAARKHARIAPEPIVEHSRTFGAVDELPFCSKVIGAAAELPANCPLLLRAMFELLLEISCRWEPLRALGPSAARSSGVLSVEKNDAAPSGVLK